MKHLTDARYAITLDDIDTAMEDARRLLALPGHAALSPAVGDVMARLLAIVEDTYGEARP